MIGLCALIVLLFCDRCGSWSLDLFSYEYELCLLTRVKDVSFLLNQWIEFHINSGVDHFYISDDCSNDGGKTMFWATFYQQAGLVSLYEKPPFLNCSEGHIPKEKLHFNFLYQKARSKCRWVSVIDADEYIFSLSNAKNDLKSALKAQSHPIVRMPWYLMSTHGHEKHQHGLLLDIYREGKLVDNLKTVIQSRYVNSWTDSHHPLKFTWWAPSVEGKSLREYSRPFFVQSYEKATDKSTGCTVPRHDLFIKHFQMLSWEDYQTIRASRTYDSTGKINAWAIQARNIWEKYNLTSGSCSHFAANSTKLLSQKIKKSIKLRLKMSESTALSFYHHNHSSSGSSANSTEVQKGAMEMAFEKWLDGSIP